MYMNLSLFLKEHSKKIKTISIITLSALSVIGVTTGLTLTIFNKDKGVAIKPHEVRHNFSLENLKKHNKKFGFEGTVESTEFEFKSFLVSINIEQDNLYYFKQLDDIKYEIKIDNPDSGLDGCYYYGKHVTSNLEDNYYGSGKLIRRYKDKYGIKGLTKTILTYFNSEEELNEGEKILIKEKKELLKDKCINLNDGGTGSFTYLNKKQVK